MLAMLAALSFGIALILEISKNGGDVINATFFLYLGLLLLALHLGGIGAGYNWRRSGNWRRRRR